MSDQRMMDAHRRVGDSIGMLECISESLGGKGPCSALDGVVTLLQQAHDLIDAVNFDQMREEQAETVSDSESGASKRKVARKNNVSEA